MLAYFDIFVGVSGDMILGSLVDAGLPLEALQKTVAALGLADAVSLQTEPVRKGALMGTKVTVVTHGEPDRPHAHLRTLHAPQKPKAPHTGEFVRPHAHGHGPVSQHEHRTLADVVQIIDGADLPSPVREQAIAVFRRLAQAEARVHGMAPDEIHFHEVGALDAIVDIVGAVAGLHALGVTRVVASPVPLTHGYVDTAHGRLPVPAPATSLLLEGIPVRGLDLEAETVTPTGAALIATLADDFGPVPPMEVRRIGYGAGAMDLPLPNLLRLWLGEAPAEEGWHVQPLVMLSTNVDDMPGEWFGPLFDRLLSAGALDVWFTPIQMKKGRPAVLITVLAPPEKKAAVRHLLLQETTTLGVREIPVQRWCVPRRIERVETPWGTVRVKVARLPDGSRRAVPEFDDCRLLAEEHRLPLMLVYTAALRAAHELNGDEGDGETRNG